MAETTQVRKILVTAELCSLSRHDQPCFEREPTLQDLAEIGPQRHLLRKGIAPGTEHESLYGLFFSRPQVSVCYSPEGGTNTLCTSKHAEMHDF